VVTFSTTFTSSFLEVSQLQFQTLATESTIFSQSEVIVSIITSQFSESLTSTPSCLFSTNCLAPQVVSLLFSIFSSSITSTFTCSPSTASSSLNNFESQE
jgi:hypothetical protein